MVSSHSDEVKSEAPSPPKSFIAGHILPYRRDALGFLMNNARQYGDVIRLQFGPFTSYQINHPDDVQQVLVKQAHKFHKSIIYKRTLSEYLGNGLLVSDGDYWKRQRRLAQPAFHTQRIHTYADVMVDYALQHADTWKPGQTHDIADDMMKLTLRIVTKTLFDANVDSESQRIGEALEVLLHAVINDMQTIIRLPEWVPTPARSRKHWSIAELHRIVLAIIQERRASGEDKGDLLSMLLLAQDEDGSSMNDVQVRDEALTIMLAGHETTANALTWTFYLLSQHPQVRHKLTEELDRVLGGRAPALSDMKALTYTEKVLKESMRLYPPAWSFGRQALEDVVLGGYRVPAASSIVMLPYVIHRDSRWYEAPEQFNPDRWTESMEAALPRYAYLPFGGGPRICIGNNFAMMEAVLILAALAQRFELALDPTQRVEPEPLVTLRPKYGMRMQVNERKSAPAAAAD